MTQIKFWWRDCSICILPVLCLITLPIQRLDAQDQVSEKPTYTSSGDLLVPRGFETWVFVGSNIGLSYKKDVPAMTIKESKRADRRQFHNVYINHDAYKFFLANKTFPEKTILVMEVFAAEDQESKGILADGEFNGQRLGLEVAVKNSSRPDGKTTPWAYYDFGDPAKPGKTVASTVAFADDACESCHKVHASVDNVWVQFYPTLRDRS